VCYRRGGTEPTVTDCNLLLGYLDRDSLLGGGLPVDFAITQAAVRERLARPLGTDPQRAAAAVIDVVNHAMAEALKIVSVGRGIDPRGFTLCAFGGAGPLHAAALADELGIAEVLCPPIPGAFSALGLVGSDLKRDYVRTVYAEAERADPARLEAAFAALEAEGTAMLARAGVSAERRRFLRQVDARYLRQSYELTVPAPARSLDAGALADISAAFHRRHRDTYGHEHGAEPVQIVNVRVTAIGVIAPLRIRQTPAAAGSDAVKARRAVWFKQTGAIQAIVYERARMPAGFVVGGPAVIESLESTILVPPGWRARLNSEGFLLLARMQEGDG
jgi:N-methylhydantoinase A